MGTPCMVDRSPRSMGPSVQQTIIRGIWGFLGEKGIPCMNGHISKSMGTLCMAGLHAITSLLATDLTIPLQ